MRLPGSATLALAAALLLVGCGTNPSPPSDPDSKLPKAKEKIKDAAEAAAEAAKAERDKYVAEARKQLAGFDARCQELRDRIVKAEGEAKKGLEKKLEEADGMRKAAAKQLDELKTAGADRWDKVKEGVGSALEALKKAFD